MTFEKTCYGIDLRAVENRGSTTTKKIAMASIFTEAELSRDGAADLTHVKPFKPIHELIDGFVEKGGVLWSCAPCFQHRGLRTEETVDKSLVVGAGPMLEWVAAGARVISL